MIISPLMRKSSYKDAHRTPVCHCGKTRTLSFGDLLSNPVNNRDRLKLAVRTKGEESALLGLATKTKTTVSR